jgi:carbon monoxide dehydrogenase subunit G
MQMEHTVVIQRPPSEVFAYLTDVSKLPEWQTSASEATVEGEMRLGAHVHEVRSMLGKRAESTLEVSEFEPDRKFSLRVVSGPLPFEVRHTLTEDDGGTRLDWVGEADTSKFPRFAVRMVAGAVEAQFKADLERLKSLLEAGGG